MSPPFDKGEFRRRLDDTLRRRDPQALRAFLIEVGQWREDDTPADLDRAMWMMIAASPALAPLHGEAERWLLAHGYQEEAGALLGRRDGGGPPRGRPQGARRPQGPGLPWRGPSPRPGGGPARPPRSGGARPTAGPEGDRRMPGGRHDGAGGPPDRRHDGRGRPPRGRDGRGDRERP